MEKKMMNYVLNVNENFNPEDYISSENGREFISLEAKTLWFRTIYPLGIMNVSFEFADGNAIATAKIQPESGLDPIVAWSACDRLDNDIAAGVQKLQEKALDKALELAGFGIEITTNSAISESESSDEEELSEATEAPKSVKKKRHRRTKAEMEAARKAEEEANSSEDENISEKSEEESLDNAKESSSEDELKDTKANTKENEMEDLDIDEISFDYDGEDDDINSLMNLVDLESDNNSEVETSETSFAIDSEDVTEDLSIDNDLENALNVVVSTVANAHPRLKQFDGMTLREVLSQHKDACEVFIRERIVPQMSPEVVDASKIILKSRM